MSENLRRYTKAVWALDAVAARVTNWDGPSPCDGWNARQVAGHAAWVVQMVGAVAAGTAPTRGLTEDEVAGDDPAATVRSSVEATLSALDQQGVLHKVAATPFGEIPVDDFLGVIWVDPFTHAWDLATAAGVAHGLDADTARAAQAALAPLSDALRAPGRFDPALPAPDGDDALAAFIAFTGRRA